MRAVFSALRVYALSQRNWFLTATTFFGSMLAFPLEYYVSQNKPFPFAPHDITGEQGDFHLTSFLDDPLALGCTVTTQPTLTNYIL